jgi:hypothetical protein
LNPNLFGVLGSQQIHSNKHAENGILLQERHDGVYAPNNADNYSDNGSKNRRPRTFKELLFAAVVIILSFLLLLAAVALQVTAIYFANRGRLVKNLKVSWCSPIFQPFGVSVQDAMCVWRPIAANSNKGIGCIEIPGVRQQRWLVATMGIVITSLILETIDFLLLILVNVKYTAFSGVKLKRPWFSILVGLAAMLTIAGVSGIQSMSLPVGINERTLVITATNVTSPFLCTGTLYPAGLRGSILGWTDGVFSSWGTVYFGSS